jgi:hypothetical protein
MNGPRIKPEIITALREWAEFEQDGGNVEQGAAIDIILDWYDRQIAADAAPELDTSRSYLLADGRRAPYPHGLTEAEWNEQIGTPSYERAKGLPDD